MPGNKTYSKHTEGNSQLWALHQFVENEANSICAIEAIDGTKQSVLPATSKMHPLHFVDSPKFLWRLSWIPGVVLWIIAFVSCCWLVLKTTGGTAAVTEILQILPVLQLHLRGEKSPSGKRTGAEHHWRGACGCILGATCRSWQGKDYPRDYPRAAPRPWACLASMYSSVPVVTQ